MPRPRESERLHIQEDTRQRLLEAAASEFCAKGFAGANIDQISRSAGFAKGTIYNYFSSKRTLMLELIETVASLHIDYMTGRILQEIGALTRLARFFESGADFVCEHYEKARLMVNTLYSHDADFRQELFQAYLPMFQFLAAQVIAPGIASGELRKVDAFKTASLLMTLYLATASQVDERRQPHLDTKLVVDFTLHALAQHADRITSKQAYTDGE